MYILCTAATRAEKNGSMKEWWNDAGQGGGGGDLKRIIETMQIKIYDSPVTQCLLYINGEGRLDELRNGKGGLNKQRRVGDWLNLKNGKRGRLDQLRNGKGGLNK